MDQTLVGQTVTRLMDDIDRVYDDNLKIKRVAVVVEVANEEGGYVHLRCSDEDTTVQIGLLYRGIQAAYEGDDVEDS